MSSRILTATTALLLLSAPALAQSPSPQQSCAERTDLLAQLKSQYEEAPVGVGAMRSGALMELTASNGGTWTLLLSMPNGVSCIMASGEGWQVQPDAKPPLASTEI
jgi:hypothetical protein